MRTGRLRHLITLQTFTASIDANRKPTRTYSTLAQVWADMSYTTGTESVVADQVEARNLVVFTIRYRSDVTPQMRVLYNSKYYEITAVLDREGRRRMLDLATTEVVP